MDKNPQLLFEIRCPKLRYMSKYGRMMKCNRKCAEVFAGSSGRAFCDACRRYGNESDKVDPYFWYEVDAGQTPKSTSIKVQKVID